uniref:Caspase-8 n=1 Tax=Phallusia mammillata TaxID=59560 RepID=A0A6F9D8Z2_9ASCI|nr:caspase-8 [Phallusia mammillata]
MDFDNGFRNLLHSIMEGLTDDNVKSIRYLCKDAIPHGKEMKNALSFLEYFEAKGWINSHDMSFLAEVLYRINRHDLLKKLPGVKNRRDYEANFLVQEPQNFTAYRIACFQLLDELTEEEFRILKNLCKDELGVRNYNRSNDILSLLVCLEEEDLVSEDDLQFMLNILQKLDSQAPYKTFCKLRDGDTSYTLPKRHQSASQLPVYHHQQSHIPLSHSLPLMQQAHYSKGEPRMYSYTGAGGYQQPTTSNRAFDGQEVGPQKVSLQTYIPSFGNTSSPAFQDQDHETVLKQHAEHDDSVPVTSISQVNTSLDHMQIPDEREQSIVNQVSEADEPAEEEFSGNIGNDGTGNRFLDMAHDVKFSSLQKDENSYKMDRNPRGLCLIINNENFEKNVNHEEVIRRSKINSSDYQVPNGMLKDRVGSQEDLDRLTLQFKSFGFDVRTYTDLDQRQMRKILFEYSRKDHSAFDCFVCVIMSHGLEGQIFGVDGMPVPVAVIHRGFTPEKCPSLVNKPKMFFFQACQGDKRMGGHSSGGHPMADVETDSPLAMPEEDHATPSEADFLVSHSTVPGFLSYRHKVEGSWFITALVNNLEMYHATDDVLSIMIRVNNEMSSKPFKQMPMPIATLRKKVYFSKVISEASKTTVAEPVVQQE